MSYQDTFDKSYLIDRYTPDYSLSTFFDTDTFFDRPLTSVEMCAGYPSKPSPNYSNPTLPATSISATSDPPPTPQSLLSMPFGQSDQYPYDFSFDPTSVSPSTHTPSRTPSLYSDAYQQGHSPSSSPRPIKRESPSSPASQEDDQTSKRPQRKRGRPRLDRSDTRGQSFGSSSSAKCQRTGRLPHNQVERKYREGLNSELERLRKAVPTLPQSDEGAAIGRPKPSKAMVLASAIEYIGRIESERDALKEENERLKQNRSNTGQVTG